MRAYPWLSRLSGRKKGPCKDTRQARPLRIRLQAEELEQRCLPSIVTLASLMDAPGGAEPYGRLIRDRSGNLFGTMSRGGPSGYGTVFEIPNGSATPVILAAFNSSNGSFPRGDLAEDGRGNLFGATENGGPDNDGTVFEVTAGSGAVTMLASFNGTNGSNPDGGVIEDSSGNLFGTTSEGGGFGYGTVFEVQSGSGSITTLAAFDTGTGGSPTGDLVQDSAGNLFGTTAGGGNAGPSIVFEVQKGHGLIILASFNTNTSGYLPNGDLALDSMGNLFGTTEDGGATGYGIIFELPGGSSTIVTLASFPTGYSLQNGVIEDSAENLFGTAAQGGPSDDGAVFELKAGSGTITFLASFNGANGATPYAGVTLDTSGNLYGTTFDGNSEGTVFELPAGSGSITTLAAFHGFTGRQPSGGLVMDSSGNVYGIASGGGAYDDGTVFEVPAGSGTITALASFNGADGSDPMGQLAIDSAGNLFGTTSRGGASGVGTVFEVAHGSGTITTLASFMVTNGSIPEGGVVEDSSGDLFGTTLYGGANQYYGSVFELLKGSNTITTLFSFNYFTSFNHFTGYWPASGLIIDSNGNLFGTTSSSVFELKVSSVSITTLAELGDPAGPLFQDSSGNLFGAASNTVFEAIPGTGTFLLASFNYTYAVYPTSGVVEDKEGNLIGTGWVYQAVNDGFVFEVKHGTHTLSTLATFTGPNGANTESAKSALIPDGNGGFIGTTLAGGQENDGTVFDVLAPFGISTMTLPDWTVNQPGYSQTIATADGTGAVTFSATGTLPPGLTLSSNGVLAGTPTATGSFTFVITAADAAGDSDFWTYTVSIHPAVTITPSNLAGGSLGAAYRQTVMATGGIGPFTFSATGQLPAGLSLASSGVLAGTPTAAGSYTFTITAMDSVGATGLASYTMVVWAIALSPLTLLNWNVSLPGYSQTLSASGGTAPYTFSATATLPTGLTLTPDGTLSGTPTVAGTYSFAVTTADSTGAMGTLGYTVVINAPLMIGTSSLPAWSANFGYSQPLNVTGGTAPLTFSMTTGTLPAGLAVSSNGVLAGTPTVAGTFNFTVTASDTVGATASQSYTLLINPAIAITTTRLPPGILDQLYSQTIAASGGTGSVVVSTTAGWLPTGLTLSSTGVIIGIPNQTGPFSFTVSVTDSVGASANIAYAMPVTIGPTFSRTVTDLVSFNEGNGATSLANTPLGGLVADTAGDLFGTTSTGSGSARFGTVFEIPQGTSNLVTLATFNGTNGTGPVGSLLIDSAGNLFGITNPFSGAYSPTVFEVAKGSHLITTLATLQEIAPRGDLVEDSAGDLFGITAAGGSSFGGTVFEIQKGSGTLTTLVNTGGNTLGGLIIDSSGNIFGTTANGGANFSPSIFEIKNGSSALTTLAIFNGNPGGEPSGRLAIDSSGDLFGVVSNVGGPPSSDGYVFELPAGSSNIVTLGAFNGFNGSDSTGGLVIDSSGNIFGTAGGGAFGWGTVFELPAGSHTILTLTSFNSKNGAGPNGDLFEDVNGNLYGTTTSGGASYYGTVFELSGLPPWPVNVPGYNQTIPASGGTGTLTFAVAGGTLPTGLTLSSAGVVSGTPTAVGSFSFLVTVTDSLGASTSTSYTVTITAVPTVKYVVTVPGSGTIQAGKGFVVAVQATDPNGNPVNYSGQVPITISPTSAGSNLPSSVTLNASGPALFLATIQRAGSYTITAGASSLAVSTSVLVKPGPAVGLAFVSQPQSTPTGDVLPPVSVQVEDQYGNVVTSDNSDVVTLSIASGPGAFTLNSTTTATVTAGVATLSNLILAVPGAYTLGTVVPTRYTGPNSSSFTVLPLQVTPGSFAGTPAGFSVQFNGPILVNAETPALYGVGLGSSATVTPTVTLTQISGTPPADTTLPYVVPGSVIIDSTGTRITFVETDATSVVDSNTPLLPDGIYVAHITSGGVNGLQALNSGGGYLDGTNAGTSGHDFTATFTVSAAAASEDVLWLPPTADGPGQSLNAPGMNQIGGGYPVYLDDNTGKVTSVQATLTYNPILLTVTPSRTATFTITVPTPGTAVLSYSGPALAAGVQTPVGFLTASVPAGSTASPMPYRAKDLLQVSGATLNNNGIPVTTVAGLHLVAYVGDADGNGAYGGGDAALITRVTLQTDSGFAAYPLVDPTIVADTDGSGFVPADAALQVNEASVGVPTVNLANPPIPSGVHFQAVVFHAQAIASLPAAQPSGHHARAIWITPPPRMDFLITDRKTLDLLFARLEIPLAL